MKFFSFGRRTPVLLVAAMALASAVPAVQALQAPTASGTTATPAEFVYAGLAYGTRASVASIVTSGESAPVGLGCTTTPGIHRTNTAANVNLAPALTSGTIDTTADTFASPVEAQTSATVQSVNLLSGLVTASLVKSESATLHGTSGFVLSSAGTTFTALKVLGIPISATVGPNTKIALPGFGYVILNEQIRTINASSASLTVNAIHLVITTTNTLKILPNTNLIVAHAMSGLKGPVAGTLDGVAYGTFARVGSVVVSGPSFQIFMPCLGTNGVVRVNSGVGVNVVGVLTSGTISNTAQGTVNATSDTGEMTSTVQSANLLSSLVQATVIKADAHAAKNGTSLSFSGAGSTFASLSVAGFPAINANVAANTQVTLTGLGTLYLHRVIVTPNSIEVVMIELVVTHSNIYGLAIGTDIRVAVAEASAH